MRVMAGFLLGVAAMLVVNSQKGREALKEIGDEVATSALNRMKELKEELKEQETKHE